MIRDNDCTNRKIYKLVPEERDEYYEIAYNTSKLRLILDILLFITIAFIFIVIAGCTSSASFHKLDNDTIYWFHYDATQRGGVLIPNDKKFRVISEPAPDVVMNELSKVLVSGKYVEIGGGIQSDYQRQAVELGKRSITVSFLRESLFRLVELSINTNISESELMKRYDNVIAAAKELALADRDAARTTLARELSQCPDNVKFGLLRAFEREDEKSGN